jgi:ditrans,polycis-polyprenyl diphosphate synthase
MKQQQRRRRGGAAAFSVVVAAVIGLVRALWGAVVRDARLLLVRVLRAGPVPRHVAFIMDGNRRFAEAHGIARAQGHAAGFEKLLDVLAWCLELGVREVTLYAFSIENFKRTREEVDDLMRLALTKLTEAIEQDDWAARHGVSMRFVGDAALLPVPVRDAVAKATKAFQRCAQAASQQSPPSSSQRPQSILNLCFAYTSRDEMARAAADICEGVRCGAIGPADVDEALVGAALELPGNPELLIRTSGECRLSDFLLWQTSYSCFVVLTRLWPALRFRDLFCAVLEYQRNHAALVRRRAECRAVTDPDALLSPRCRDFIDSLRRRRLDALCSFDTSPTPSPTAGPSS